MKVSGVAIFRDLGVSVLLHSCTDQGKTLHDRLKLNHCHVTNNQYIFLIPMHICMIYVLAPPNLLDSVYSFANRGDQKLVTKHPHRVYH